MCWAVPKPAHLGLKLSLVWRSASWWICPRLIFKRVRVSAAKPEQCVLKWGSKSSGNGWYIWRFVWCIYSKYKMQCKSCKALSAGKKPKKCTHQKSGLKAGKPITQGKKHTLLRPAVQHTYIQIFTCIHTGKHTRLHPFLHMSTYVHLTFIFLLDKNIFL